MQRWIPLFVLLLAPLAGRTQLEVRCVLKESVVLRYEEVRAEVHIKNLGSDPVVVSTNAPSAVIRLVVNDNTPDPVPRADRPLLLQPVALPPGESVRFPFDINRTHALRENVPHTLTAQVEHDGMRYSAPRVFFDVVEGAEILRVAKPAVARLYSLRSVNRGERLALLLRVDDPEAGLCYGVHELDRYHRGGGRPEMLIDSRGNIHVKFSQAPGALAHTESSRDGVLISKKYYLEDSSRTPVFGPDGKGGVSLTGATPVK